jgi:hypothetical protein
MDILNLTTTQAVRAAVGISGESGELEDQVFVDLDVPSLLRLELSSWIPAPVSEIEAAAFSAADETEPEALAYAALRAASTYYCAILVMESAEISFAERHEDGQNKLKRQAHDTQEILTRLRVRYAGFQQQVLDYLEAPTTASTSWMIGRSVPAYDPVTNS